MKTPESLLEARRSGALDELGSAFMAWAESHGVVWFETDARLRDELAAVLGIELRMEGDHD